MAGKGGGEVRAGARGVMKRRDFLGVAGVSLAAFAGLGGRAEARGRTSAGTEFIGPELEPKRTAEILCFDQWMEVGSLSNLRAGDVFRLREPDGELIDDDPDIALGAPYKTSAGGGGKWTWSIECAGGFWPWALVAYDADYTSVPCLKAVYIATLPDPVPTQVKRFESVVGFVRPGALVVLAHFDDYPNWVPTQAHERKLLKALKGCPDSFVFSTAAVRQGWGTKKVVPDQAPVVWVRDKIATSVPGPVTL